MKKIYSLAVILTLVFALSINMGTNIASAAEKGKYGGTLIFNHSKTADIIGDPILTRAWNGEFVTFVLQTLLKQNNDDPGIIEPNLATEWKLAENRSTCIFKLRKGVKFHDGTDFNARAVKWNFDRYIASKGRAMDTVSSCEVLDDYTIKLYLKAWDATFISDYYRGTNLISPTAFEKNGADWARYNPVGTGPFKVVRYKRNTVIEYDKNEDYWREGLPYLDHVKATQIGDPMTATLSLKRGEIDAWLGVDPISAGAVRDEGKFNVDTTPAVHNVLQFNSEDPDSIWSNKKVRQALEYAIDKEGISKALGKGFWFPVYEVIHSISIQKQGPVTTPRKYDPEKARQLLKEAGIPNGVKVKLSYTAGPGTYQDMVVAIQGMLAKVGIDLIPNPLTGAAMNTLSFEPPPANMLILIGQRGGPGDLIGPLKESFGENTVFFQGLKQPDGFPEMLKQALQTDDWSKQLPLVVEMEKLAYEDCTLVGLNGEFFATLSNPRIKDAVWFYAGSPSPYIEEAWIKN